MFSSSLLTLALAAVVSASAIEVRQAPGSQTTDSCNSGTLQCCNQVINGEDYGGWGLFAIGCGDGDGIGGGNGASNCAQQSVCCENVYQNGFFAWGCSPVSIGA